MTVYRLMKNRLSFSAAKISSVKYSENGILVNNQPVTTRTVLKSGDVLKIRIDDSENRREVLYPVAIPLDILFEDDYLIVLNKPSGLVCHPSKGHYFDALANGLRFYFDTAQPNARIHLTGRLDKETSGIVTVAKNGYTADLLKLLKERGRMRKTYLALASGVFKESEGSIDIPMSMVRDPENGMLTVKRGDSAHGLPAMTHYQVLWQSEDAALLSVTIDTGRMHQIRFHMAEIGHPLFGDKIYDGPKAAVNLMLHAYQLDLIHPHSGEKITLLAPLPEAFLPFSSVISSRTENAPEDLSQRPPQGPGNSLA